MFHARRIVCSLLLVFGFSALAWAAGQMSVQVKEAEVRQGPSFLAAVVARVPYGTQVMIQSEKGAWAKASTPGGVTGFIHLSALTEKEVQYSGGGSAGSGASSQEVALAGKGFNQAVESQYRSQNPGISFVWIDRMEAIRISASQMQAFLNQGGLNAPGGAQ